MTWEKLVEALDELKTTVEYNGCFYSKQNTVLGSVIELLTPITLNHRNNIPRRGRRGTVLNVSHCMFS